MILLLSLFFNPSVFLTPSPYGHSPYLIYDEQRERIENGISRFGTKIALYPSPLSHNTTGHGWGEGIKKLSGIYTAR